MGFLVGPPFLVPVYFHVDVLKPLVHLGDADESLANVEQSAFNDWFCGHLNFQIEHHLFPTMPRHSYHLITSRVEKLCTKHGLSYQSKTLLGAFGDIVESLRASGELWYEAMHLD